MKLHEMKYTKGSKHAKKRVGRGQGSGQGTTAGRGMNGQKSRSGGNVRPGFEGGQLPLYKRLPKRGFSNARFKKEYAIVSLEQLNVFEDGQEITVDLLKEQKIIKKELSGVKILANGQLDKKLNLKINKISKSAREAVEKQGGTVEVV